MSQEEILCTKVSINCRLTQETLTELTRRELDEEAVLSWTCEIANVFERPVAHPVCLFL